MHSGVIPRVAVEPDYYLAMWGSPLAAAACSGVQPSSSFLLILAPCWMRILTQARLSSSTA